MMLFDDAFHLITAELGVNCSALKVIITGTAKK